MSNFYVFLIIWTFLMIPQQQYVAIKTLSLSLPLSFIYLFIYFLAILCFLCFFFFFACVVRKDNGALDRKSTSELQSPHELVCRLLLEKKKKKREKRNRKSLDRE